MTAALSRRTALSLLSSGLIGTVTVSCAAPSRLGATGPSSFETAHSPSSGPFRSAKPVPIRKLTVAPSRLRTWLSGYAGDSAQKSQAAWTKQFGFAPQALMFYSDWESSWSSRASTIQDDQSLVFPAVGGGKLNILTLGLLLAAPEESGSQRPNPAALARAAHGVDKSAWITMGRAIREAGLNAPSTIVRLGHEMNGNWLPWGTDGQPKRAAEYCAAWRIAVHGVRRTCPLVRFDLCFSAGTGGKSTLDLHYPGDDFVDIVSMDFYDFAESTSCEGFLRSQGSLGFNEVSTFAHSHRKKFALPEWGLNGNDTNQMTRDNPFYVNQVYSALELINFQFPGLVLYDSYFDQDNNFGLKANPKSAAAYRANWARTRV